MPKYILALDQGTTSSRAVLFDEAQNIISLAQKEFPQIYLNDSWVEHDPADIISSQREVMMSAVRESGVDIKDIAAIGITNQRETTILWDKNTGEPVYNAIVWQCRRTADIIGKLVDNNLTDTIRSRTGLIPDAYFSASKISWLLTNIKGLRERALRGEILFGTIDTWLLWNLTNGRLHITDYTNASRTMLFNIHTLKWDDTLLEIFDIPQAILPEVRSSSEIYGHTGISGFNIPIAGMAGDQQAALFGQCCFESGDVKNTYGTGCFLLMNTGSRAYDSKSGMLTTIAAGTGGKPPYALEGSVFSGGLVVQWLRDGLGLIDKSSDIEALAAAAEDTNGVYFVPAFTGLGTPYWDMHARGIITGLTRAAAKEHIARAALESIAYQSNDMLDAMESDTGIEINDLKADGGASVNNLLMQLQADISGKRVIRPVVAESTALGAAYLAGLAADVWENTSQLKALWQSERIFTPQIDAAKRENMLINWKKAVSRCRSRSE